MTITLNHILIAIAAIACGVITWVFCEWSRAIRDAEQAGRAEDDG